MVGPNRSSHHLDSISVPVDMIAAGLWGKCNWEICARLFVSLYRNLKTFCIIGIFLLHHRYNCCSHRYGLQSQLKLRSYRTERIMIISFKNDRNVLLLVVNSFLCFKGEELRNFSLISIKKLKNERT
jgi:hypothetical protein